MDQIEHKIPKQKWGPRVLILFAVVTRSGYAVVTRSRRRMLDSQTCDLGGADKMVTGT